MINAIHQQFGFQYAHSTHLEDVEHHKIFNLRQRRLRNLFKNEEGSIAPIFALILFFLIGIAAFVIDFGLAYMKQSELQAVADSEALACAQFYGSCTSGDDPYPEVNPNGFTIALTKGVACPNPTTQTNCVKAIVSTKWDRVFTGIFGYSGNTLEKSAVAGKVQGGYEVFFIKRTFSANGNNQIMVVDGSVAIGESISTTNKTGIIIVGNGSTTVYNGNSPAGCGACSPAVVGTSLPLPPLPTYTPPSSPTVRSQPTCIGNIGNYLPGTYNAKVSMNCGLNHLAAGVYYFNGGLETNTTTVTGENVTVIIGSAKPVDFTGDITLSAPDCNNGDGMLIYQEPSASLNNWTAKGSRNSFMGTGRIILPNTSIDYRGASSSFSVTGGVYADNFTTKGNVSAGISALPCQNIDSSASKNRLFQ